MSVRQVSQSSNRAANRVTEPAPIRAQREGAYPAGRVDRAEVDQEHLLDDVVERGALALRLLEEPLEHIARLVLPVGVGPVRVDHALPLLQHRDDHRHQNRLVLRYYGYRLCN